MTAAKLDTLLVPIDFTSISDCAIDNAIEIAQTFNQNITLFHVIGKNKPKTEREAVNSKLRDISEMMTRSLSVSVNYHIKEGSIFNAITNAVSEFSATMIVMGIHGNPKEKDILGSFAYNVICSSRVPVMIVKSCNDKIEDNLIVAPVNFSYDNKQMSENAIKYAKELKCSVLVSGVLFHKRSLYKTIISKEKKEQQLKEIANKIKNAGINVKTDILIKPKNILVPTDFTLVANKALDHAIEIARTFERQIYLLHVVGKTAKPAEIEKIENQLKHLADANKKQHGIEISYILKRGSIFEAIPDTISEISAGFMVIGLHGAPGIENMQGSFANTIVSNSTVPVMVVKKQHFDIKENKMLVQINYPQETVDKIKSSLKYAKAFDCIVNIVGVIHSSEIPDKKEKEKFLDRIMEYMSNKEVRFKVEIRVKTHSLLVPTDFTSIGQFAIDYAVEIAKLSGQNIYLLHIVDETIQDKDLKKATSKIDTLAKDICNATNVNATGFIEKGNILNTIPDKASEISADMIIMGTHGKKGLQHIMGSNAFKVVKNSKIPVLVLKNEYPQKGIKNIIVPISFENENTQKINKSIDIAKLFNSTIHLIGFLSSTGSVYKIEKEVLIKNVASHVENSGIPVKTEIITKTKKSIYEDLLYYAAKVDANLIVFVAEKSNMISEIFGRNYAENIIHISDIPVLNIIPYADFEEDEAYAVGSFIDPFGLMRKNK
ncbi:MAG: universal stress protein [Bacteroidota bacterium]